MAAGHRHGDVMTYTWGQFTAYLRLARQDRASRRADQLVDTSNAFAGGDAATKLLRALRALSDQAEG